MKDNLNNLFKKHDIFARKPAYSITLIVFLLLFMGGARFSIINSLILAFIDSIAALLTYYLFSWLLIKQPFKIRQQAVNILIIALLVFITSAVSFSLEYLAMKFLFVHTNKEPFPQEYSRIINTSHFFKNLLLMMGSLIFSIYSYSRKKDLQSLKLEDEKKSMQIQLLQSQINPHFLFNALNNIYALVYTKDDLAPEAIIKLSEMLRYVTDISRAERVPIENELAYISHYLDFQYLRTGSRQQITYQTDIDSKSVFITPMILQPFIENCFNHSDIITNPDGFIRINIILKNKLLLFTTENSYHHGAVQSDKKNKRDGIGLYNVEQRLKIFYNNNYSLLIDDTTSDLYRLTLTIDLTSSNNE